MKELSTIMFMAAVICLSACQEKQEESMTKKIQGVDAPIATKKDTTITWHGHDREDPYYWMRLTDEQKNAETPDNHTQEVLDYLNAENSYTKQVMNHTEEMQTQLYDEIVGRIKQTDESVPYIKNGYWYYTRYEEGKEYPIYCRKKGTLEADEEVMLDANKRAEGKDYYAASGLSVSPDNKILAFAEDYLSRRIYTYKFKNLETGEIYTDELSDAQPGGAWANDNLSLIHISEPTRPY